MSLKYVPTKAFWTIDLMDAVEEDQLVPLCVNMACPYTSRVVKSVVSKLSHCIIKEFDVNKKMVQVADFENIEWEPVLEGKQAASSYLVRKGLSRKAQLALQIKRHISKHPNSLLKDTVPFSVIIETWDAFEDMKVSDLISWLDVTEKL